MAVSRLCSVLLSFLFFFILGCSSNVKLQIKKAPELNLVGVKTLKIQKFEISGDLDLDLMNKSGGLLGTVVGMAVDAGANKLAQGRHEGIQQAGLSGLKQVTFQNGYYKVVDGDDCDVSVTGNIYYNVRDEGTDEEDKDDKGNVTRWYEIKRKADVKVKFSITDKSGHIIGMSEVAGSSEKTAKGDDRDEARENVTAWESVVRDALARTNEPFIKKIAPYFVWENRTFEKGESKIIKQGNKAAKNGNWGEAVLLWQQAQSSGSAKDPIAVLYNLAIYDEVEGKLQDALSKFEEVQKTSGNAKYSRDIARTKARIEEEKKLKEAENAR